MDRLYPVGNEAKSGRLLASPNFYFALVAYSQAVANEEWQLRRYIVAIGIIFRDSWHDISRQLSRRIDKYILV